MPASQHQKLARQLKGRAKNEATPASQTNPFSKTCDKVASARLLRIPQLAPEKDEVRLALISLPPFINLRLQEHTILQAKSAKGVDLEACQRILVGHPPLGARELLEMYEVALKTAVETQGAKIVCFNELGFPSWNQEPHKRAVELTRRLANTHQCLVVAGSNHDRRTLYNTSHLFYPGCGPDGLPYHKQISAASVGELVSVPARRRTICTRVFGLNVAVLICLDLADFSAVASVVKLSERVDVLLVPCYSEYMDSLDRVAKAASAALQGIVALVNYRPVAPKAPCLVEEFGRSRPVDGAIELPFGGMIHTVRIQPPALQKKKLEVKGGMDERMEWLFGAQNVEPR